MPVKYRILPVLTPQDITRFWSKVLKLSPDECWLWLPKRRMSSGYGKFTKRKVDYGAHRIAYFVQHGLDPSHELVCHSCDNKLCVNGAHLFLGSHQVNADDMKRKARSASGDRNGMRTHPERTSSGEKNGYAKLTNAEVREICRAYDAGEADQYQLAERFNVWQMTISRIVRRVSRKSAHIH
jgi:hypothetical protein